MATTADVMTGVRSDERFFARFAIGLSAFIVLGFAQFGLRGFVDYANAPWWMHVHGAIMISWLAVFCIQATLVAKGNLAQHRKLGWIAAYLAVAVVGMGCFIGVMAIKTHVQPPFFTPPYFLALTQVGAVVFGGLVFAAITRRTQTDYHRRLMAGSLIALTEPALGRWLPMPFMVGWGEWVVLAIQLGFVAIIALHDRRTIGRIHPATATVGAIIAMMHVLVEVAALNPWVSGIAASIARG